MSYLDRLRPASFISPDGTEHFFFVNSLERSSGKKGSTQEILDSGESISQDQGNKVTPFPMNAYFPGPDYDSGADAFYNSFEQQYTQDKPGILKHPRWGDVNVFPFTWSQKEELVDGANIARIDVTFREVFPTTAPRTDADNISDASSNIDSMEDISQELAGNIVVDSTSATSNLKGKLTTAKGLVSNSLGKLASRIQSVEDEFKAIEKGFDSLIDEVGTNIVDILATTQRLIRLPGKAVTQTVNTIEVYSEMISDLCNSLLDDSESSIENLKNNSITMQLIAGFSVSAMGEAAATVQLETRSQAIATIDLLQGSLDLFNIFFQNSRTDGSVSEEYSGDHNFYSLLLDTIRRINNIILNEAFDLKAEKSFILKTNSDPITLCYKNYGDVQNDTIDFFITSNKLTNDEFVEIPAGREILVYV